MTHRKSSTALFERLVWADLTLNLTKYEFVFELLSDTGAQCWGEVTVACRCKELNHSGCYDPAPQRNRKERKTRCSYAESKRKNKKEIGSNQKTNVTQRGLLKHELHLTLTKVNKNKNKTSLDVILIKPKTMSTALPLYITKHFLLICALQMVLIQLLYKLYLTKPFLQLKLTASQEVGCLVVLF